MPRRAGSAVERGESPKKQRLGSLQLARKRASVSRVRERGPPTLHRHRAGVLLGTMRRPDAEPTISGAAARSRAIGRQADRGPSQVLDPIMKPLKALCDLTVTLASSFMAIREARLRG